MNVCFLGCGNIAQAMIDGLIRSGVSSSSITCIERNEIKVELLKEKNLKVIELDNLAAEISATMTTTHPDYAKLAARISVSNLHKNTKKFL